MREVRQCTQSRVRAQQTPVEELKASQKQLLMNVLLQSPVGVNMSTHANKAAVKLFYSAIW